LGRAWLIQPATATKENPMGKPDQPRRPQEQGQPQPPEEQPATPAQPGGATEGSTEGSTQETPQRLPETDDMVPTDEGSD
jgi:hypothetical protein